MSDGTDANDLMYRGAGWVAELLFRRCAPFAEAEIDVAWPDTTGAAR